MGGRAHRIKGRLPISVIVEQSFLATGQRPLRSGSFKTFSCHPGLDPGSISYTSIIRLCRERFNIDILDRGVSGYGVLKCLIIGRFVDGV